MTSPFQYQPLKDPGQWIRILFLEPSMRMDAPLRGRLSDANMATHPEYHAVSYLWGDPNAPPTDSCEVVLSGSNETSQLPLMKNCSDALRHLRWKTQPRPLWIDAICIDQSNDAEKGCQVRIMEFIYKEASQVVVWLDLKHIPGSRCKEVFKAAERFAGLVRKGYIRVHQDDTQREANWYNKRVQNSVKRRCERLRPIFMLILDNPYFSRTWTIQELVVGVLQKTVVVTHAGQVQWAHILALAPLQLVVSVSSARDEKNMRVHRRLSCRGAFSHIKPSLDGSNSDLRLAPMWSSETSNYPFEDISSLSASEPKDKAYAFLWALPRSREMGLDIFDVDYTKSVETIFTEFTVAVAHETGDILPLLYMACQKFRMSTLPSWVPDWTIAPRYEEWSFWRRLGSGDTKGILKHKNEEFKFGSERVTFTHGAMVVSGFSKTDRVSQRESLPFLSGDKGTGLETVFLHHYDPRVLEKLIVGLHNVFKVLDKFEDMLLLTTLYVDPSVPMATRNDVPTPPRRRYESEAVAFLTMRGIVCTYMQAKKSENHCDVDRDKWQIGIREELTGLFTEDFVEKTVLMISELGGPDTRNPWGFENHMVSELISWMMTQVKLNVFWPVAEIAGGEMGAVIFKTESGRIGLAQANVEVGDDLVQWEGAPCPVIIRRLMEQAPDHLPEGIYCRLVSIAKATRKGQTDNQQWQRDNLIKYLAA